MKQANRRREDADTLTLLATAHSGDTKAIKAMIEKLRE